MFDSRSYYFLFAVLVGGFIFVSCSTEPVEVEATVSSEIPEEIAHKMQLQIDAWNSGSIDAFMAAGYWQSDELMFVGSRGLTYGYEQVLANYRLAYPDGAARGVLQFENLKWLPLGAEHGLLAGKWMIDRAESEDISGHYSLIWKKTSSGWLIIADHSS